MPYSDKNKQLEYKKKWNKEYYLKNRQSEKERIYKRRRKIFEWFMEYKSTLSCKQCGESTSVCLDFHHIGKEEKDIDLGYAKKWGWGIKRIKKEIDKCIVLCSNCHRKVHVGMIEI